MSDHAALEQLLVKYRALVELRTSREEAIRRGLAQFPAAEAAGRRALMRELAAHFPGALRELDVTGACELTARAAAVERALLAGEAERWMTAAIVFHRLLAAQLRRRRAGGAPRPATGRVLDDVWAAVASLLGTSAREAELLVYPAAPARGTRR